MQVRQDQTGDLNMQHVEALRDMINARLQRIGTRHAQRQIHDFPWLFGALGEVPSRVMLVCVGRSRRRLRLPSGPADARLLRFLKSKCNGRR
jgi:hypothetical protein